MERHHRQSGGGESEPRREGGAPDARTLKILQRYAAGEISARQAAREMGPQASEHDVFAGVIAAHLPLPSPPPDEVAREVAALRALYGPHGPRPRGSQQPIDWSQCDDVESVPDRLSGTWVVKGTRVPAQAIIDNAEDGYTAEQIATEIFDNLPLDRVRGVLRFAKLGLPSRR